MAPIASDSGTTYRSAIHRASRRSRSSNTGTLDTTRRTGRTRPGRSAAGPRTHPRTVRPWNGIDTRSPVPGACSSGRR
jgi:hypothetical protein